ncbi:hypothetical protein HanXRQr2_Chr07g0286231 [Helianthus annuus]|uniref:Uncharacterized protein n=1 Tax=Helianthus annuus TaxID=4232 RepID=A0A9K3IJU5_HELAN|nr:hypothetical protein HanXRQr2_Chr07g0286231 [Helianthus annuus]KAJ0904034.1 hypothetical protein HanPSC8_Chr07g0277131 [Helianthus annuus]
MILRIIYRILRPDLLCMETQGIHQERAYPRDREDTLLKTHTHTL